MWQKRGREPDGAAADEAAHLALRPSAARSAPRHRAGDRAIGASGGADGDA